jgi:DNA-binding phage protein
MPELIEIEGKKYLVEGELYIAEDKSHVLYREVKYVWMGRGDQKGYYRNFSRGKPPCNLHRAIYRDHFGTIPPNFHVHHLDRNTKNNRIENLQCLPASVHLSRTQKTNKWLKSEENKKQLNDKEVREKIKVWQRSEEERKTYSKAKEKDWKKRKKSVVKCQYCGKDYEASFPSRAKYCHKNCKENARKKSGVENENRKCVACQKYFIANRFTRIKTCNTHSCIEELKRRNREAEHMPEEDSFTTFLLSIKELMRVNGHATEVAKKSKINLSTIQNLFYRSNPNPELKTILLILHGLGYDLSITKRQDNSSQD